MQKGTAATIQDFSPACEVVTKGTDVLTIRSETRHLRVWTADLRVSAGRSRCPEARKEGKAAPSLCPSLGDLTEQVFPQDQDSACEGPARAQVRGTVEHLCLGDTGEPRERVHAPPSLLIFPTLTLILTPEPAKQHNHVATCHSSNTATSLSRLRAFVHAVPHTCPVMTFSSTSSYPPVLPE